jgi:iron complex transport system substrate-binding protein
MPRVVSLIASATEIVCALGLEDQLVGRSHECDFPPSVRRLPVCTAPKFDVHGSSREIDGRVKSVLQDATSVYRVDEGLLQRLRPDVVLTQSQCDVCAVSLTDVEDALGAWVGTRPRVLSLAPNRLSDIWEDIRPVAELLEVPGVGAELTGRLRGRMQDIERKAAHSPHRPTVACLEWTDPLMAAGNWVPELVEMAGGTNLFGVAGAHSPWMTWEQLCERDPDVIVSLPCGFDLAKTRAETLPLESRAEWSQLRAVRAGRVAVADGNQYFNRPGPRVVESLEILAEILHPREFDFGHRGTGWEPL